MHQVPPSMHFGMHWSERLRVAPIFELSEAQEAELTRLAQLKNRGNSQSFAPMHTEVHRWRYLMHLSSLKNQTVH